MRYQELAPPTALAAYVKCLWVLEGHGDGGQERILPDGNTELIFHYTDGHSWVGDKRLQAVPRSVLVGQLSRYLLLQSPQGTVRLLAARLWPWGAYALFGTPMYLLQDSSLPLADVLGKAAGQWEDCIYTQEPLSAAHTLMGLLGQQLGRSAANNNVIQAAVNMIARTAGNVDMAALAHHANLSTRQLTRRFWNEVGLNPKQLARIARLQRFMHLQTWQPKQTLTKLALDAGYYDQPHFVRDFVQLTGLSPSQYYKQAHAMNNLFQTTGQDVGFVQA